MTSLVNSAAGAWARLRVWLRRGKADQDYPEETRQREPAREPSVAALIARLCALLRGGVAPSRVFGALATETDSPVVAREIGARIDDGEGVVSAIASASTPEWRILAVAWMLAEESGAPLAPALDRIGAALRSLELLRERRRVLLAGPRATVRLVAALPALALLLGGLLGFDPLPVLLSPLGVLLLTAGALLLASGIAWARLLQRRIEDTDRIDAVEFELLWIALGGGSPAREACRRVVDCIDSVGAEWVPFDRFLRRAPLLLTIDSAVSAGIPLRSLLLEEASAVRERAQSELEQEAERLGISVLIPLGVCVLPSFVLIGVVPVVISMLRI